MKKNVLIFIHGMSPVREAYANRKTYEAFFERLCAAQPLLKTAFSERVYVEWGHPTPASQEPLRPDERIMKAENVIHERVNYKDIKKSPNPLNKLTYDLPIPFVRKISERLKEGTVIFGLGDVVYYCSPSGEGKVRKAVYGQVLEALKKYKDDEVRLHVIAHSLGCAVAFDFLYGLFAPSANWLKFIPDFASESEYGAEYAEWRSRVGEGRVKFGSMASMASQLPILFLRKQKLIDMLFSGEFFKADVIGISASESAVRWKIFYDVDDILAYPTRNFFRPNDAIMDIQVDVEDLPHKAHELYWENERVVREVADLFVSVLYE